PCPQALVQAAVHAGTRPAHKAVPPSKTSRRRREQASFGAQQRNTEGWTPRFPTSSLWPRGGGIVRVWAQHHAEGNASPRTSRQNPCSKKRHPRMNEQIKLKSGETKSSWIVAVVVLLILALSFGAPWIAVVALKAIAAETGGQRSVPALASSLAWVGYGAGGIVMGYVAERIGVRWTVIFGAAMICA